MAKLIAIFCLLLAALVLVQGQENEENQGEDTNLTIQDEAIKEFTEEMTSFGREFIMSNAQLFSDSIFAPVFQTVSQRLLTSVLDGFVQEQNNQLLRTMMQRVIVSVLKTFTSSIKIFKEMIIDQTEEDMCNSIQNATDETGNRQVMIK